ncbi:MAG: c-type cytochrome [Myxococcota bacterium]
MRLVPLLFLIACGAPPESQVRPPDDIVSAPDRIPVEGLVHSTGSTTLVVDPYGELINVNVDSGTISRTNPRTNAVIEVPVGSEPTRLAIAGDSLWVTLRNERAVVELGVDTLEAGVIRRVELGAEPFGIVASPDGSRVYVALSQDAAVLELDANLQVLRSFTLPGEPRYLALHPGLGHLYVGLGRSKQPLRDIDLASGAITAVPLPDTELRQIHFEVDETDPEAEPEPEPIPLESRITGDLWVTDDGSRLLVPALYLDTTTPIMALSSIAEIPGFNPEIEVEPNPGGYGGSISDAPIEPVDRITPAVVEVGLRSDGTVTTGMRALYAATQAGIGEPGQVGVVGSYISSVCSSPTGDQYVATMEASRAAVLIDATGDDRALIQLNRKNGSTQTIAVEALHTMGFEGPRTKALSAADGTNGAVFVGDDALYLHNAFAETVIRSDLVSARASLLGAALGAAEAAPAVQGWPVSRSDLGSQIREGRALFYSARGFQTGATGVSCSTCHFEGRNDGVTWTFDDGPRQTPTLAGVVSETQPVTWRSGVPSVMDEANITIRGRFFGPEADFATLSSIAAFVDHTRLPDPPTNDPAAVERGAQVFVQAACSGCHLGSRAMDNSSHLIRGVEVNTPTLSGIAASAPYFHDGSSPTLRDVLERSRDGSMGNTASLTSAQMDDLEAYLRSL